MSLRKRIHKTPRRRGATAVMVMVSLVVLIGMASMTIDVGMMYRARSEAQACSDASALAATCRLVDQDRLRGSSYVNTITTEARQTGADVASRNPIAQLSPTLDLNTSNNLGGDVLIGRLNNPNDPHEQMTFGDASRYNAVRTFLHRDGQRNGPINLFFAGVLGHETTNISASATAALFDGVVGWRVTEETGNAGILPFALRKSIWDQLLAGTWTTGDNYAYNSATGYVSSGHDGIQELNLYPGAGSGQLPPGNFGTVDIGSPNNSAADLARQIRHGVNAQDLSYFGGSLELGSDGTLTLNGDTGLSAGIKDDLTAIIGQPRAIPIFTQVSGPGNNSNFTVVGFVGIRILYVKLTGAMNSKQVIIQPAYLIDDSVIVGENTGQSSFVYAPVRLVR